MKAPWATRFLILQGFIVFDLSLTWLSISSLAEESNIIARGLMQVIGPWSGLILFSGIITGVLFLVLLFCSHMFDNVNGLVKSAGTIALDFGLAWFVAGVHFAGGTSWCWLAPQFLRHLIGANIYLAAIAVSWKMFFGNRVQARQL